MNGEVRVVTLVGKKRGNPGSRTWGVVVGEFCKWEECIPIVLLVVAEYTQILFQGLIRPFSLSITFGMISRCEVESHVECLSEGAEKSRDKLGTTIGSDMFGDTMFGEHVSDEEDSEVFRGAMDSCRNEDALFGESVNNH